MTQLRFSPRPYSARRGASALEILSIAGVLLVVLGGLISLGTNSATEYALGASKIMADTDASLTLQKLVREVRDGISATVDSPTSLTVVLPSVNAQGDYDRYTPGVSVRYYLNNKTLYRQAGTADAVVLGRNIRNLVFSSESTPAGPRLKVALTCRQQVGTRKKETVLSSAVTLRNEVTP